MDSQGGHMHGAVPETLISRGVSDPPRVRDIMQRKIVQISADERLSTVDDIMTLGGVRHIPVVRGGELVGVVSERDLLRASLSSLSDFASDHRRAFLQGVEIRRVMSSPAVTVGPDTPVEEAARLLAERKIGCLPVLDGDRRLVGLITETDVLRCFATRLGSSVSL
ncbi:MAG: CBS domain-containing protein [Myxococcota bacterium]